MFNSNREILVVDGVEYTLTLDRAGMEAIEKYTKLSEKSKEFKNISTEIEYVDEIKEDEDPFADVHLAEDFEQKLEEELEIMKRVLWIMLYKTHKMNIEEVKALMNKIIDLDLWEELNKKVQNLIEGISKKSTNEYLKNMKALKAQK